MLRTTPASAATGLAAVTAAAVRPVEHCCDSLRGLLLATHGRPSAAGAIATARLLARQHAASVDVISVAEPHDASGTHAPDEAWAAAQAQLGELVARQLEGAADAGTWPLHLAAGPAALAICATAADRDIDLIVLGDGPHHATDRVLGGEVAVHVVQQATVPVLVVPEHVETLPSTILVGTDFSEASICAARLAVAMRDRSGGARLHIVHVRTRFEPFPVAGVADEIYASGIDALFRAFEHTLHPPEDVEITHEVRDGEPGEQLRQCAHEQRADLVAVGSHGRCWLSRSLLGSVPPQLVRDGGFSVVVSGLQPALRPHAAVDP